MTSGKIEQLRDQLAQAEQEDYNNEAFLELAQEWCINVSQNIPLLRMAKNIPDIPKRKKDTVIVVGAAPELKDEDIEKLKDYKGDIIITNKNFQRFYDKLGITPTWVVLLDAHPISNQQFSWMSKLYIEDDIKFLVASVVYPETLMTIMSKTDNVYAFNPITDVQGNIRLSKSWEWMNDKQEMEHGGSVGSLAVHLAKHQRYEYVGLLGYGLCEKTNPNWTPEQASPRGPEGREYIYYPDIDQTVAIPRNFKAYLSYIMFNVQDSARWATYWNLGESAVLRHSPLLKQATVETFEEEVEKERKFRVKEKMIATMKRPGVC